MALIKLSAGSDQYWLLNDIPHQRGQFDISATIGQDVVEIFNLATLKSVARGNYFEFSPDGITPYASTQLLIDDLKSFFFRSVAGGGGGSVNSVTATTPLASTGGTDPIIDIIDGSNTDDILKWDGANWVVGPNLIGDQPAWAQYSDTQYTDISPLTITGGVAPVTIPNNALSTIDSYMPSGIKFYDEVTQKITPQGLGENYLLRVNFKASSTTNQNYLTLDLDIGGTQGIILEKVTTFPRGAGITHAFSSTSLLFSLGTFIANGGELMIAADDNITIWDIQYVITRVSANDLNLADAPSDGNDYLRNNGSWVQATSGGTTLTQAESAVAFNGGLDLNGNTYYFADVTLPGLVLGDQPEVGVNADFTSALILAGIRLSNTLYEITGANTVRVYINVSSFLTGNANYKAIAKIIK